MRASSASRKAFAEDQHEPILLEWQEDLSGPLARRGHDAQVPVVPVHQDVPAAEVDLVGVQVARRPLSTIANVTMGPGV
jgi:hypothetical protein